MSKDIEKIELRPNVFATSTVVVFIFILIIFAIFGYTILPKAYNLYNELPSPDTFQIYIISLIGLFLPPLFFIFIVWSNTRGIKIVVDGKLLFFHRKSLFRTDENKVLDLEKVENIGYRKQVIPIFTGKALMVITRYWFIFNHKDGHKEEVMLDGWDVGTLKKLIFLLRDKYPDLKWNTHIYQDTPEKLAGIDKIIKAHA